MANSVTTGGELLRSFSASTYLGRGREHQPSNQLEEGILRKKAKKHRGGGEPLAASCPIRTVQELNHKPLVSKLSALSLGFLSHFNS